MTAVIQPRMLNQREAMRYMKATRGRFFRELTAFGYAGTDFGDGGGIVYDRKVLDKIMDLRMPHRCSAVDAAFESSWLTV